jgi:hypothetical protein
VTGIVAPRLIAAISAVLFASAALGACSKDAPAAKGAGGRPQSAQPAGKDDSAAGSVELGGGAYKPGVLASSGSISGTIKLNGAARNDIVQLPDDVSICGKTAPGAVTATDKGLSNTVVWIADVQVGKPLPVERRIDLSSEDCGLDPRVQATIVGTTTNVTNDDKLLHKLVFTLIGSHDTLTKMPFFNAGQVVASERLARKAGIVEVRCLMHPWTRGYIAVFDHPYFAVTGADGSFKIDSLPPGTYKLMVWHEGADKAVEQQVQVTAGGVATADVALSIPVR